MKSIPLSALAERTKGPKVKPATPTMTTGRKLDELRIHPAENGFVVHASTTSMKPPSVTSFGGGSGASHPTVFAGPQAHVQAAAHVASILAEHAERMKAPK